MGCTHNCETCGENCHSKGENTIPKEELNKMSSVKKVIGVVSGKGGVGKSLVTSAMAVSMNRRGFKTAIMDADITGPSIPNVFGVHGGVVGDDMGIYPAETEGGVKLMSINLLLENETDPVVWRGPVIAGTVKQFWTEFIWNDVDYMFIDMPPGTGDVPLTVFQSIPLDGIIVVASVQELVSMIVEKAAKMAELMNIPIIGIVENMSYFKCPDCGKEHRIFGESHTDEVAEKYGTKVIARLPIDPTLAKCTDTGTMELFVGDYFEKAADEVEKL